jgi:hypothetical protein
LAPRRYPASPAPAFSMSRFISADGSWQADEDRAGDYRMAYVELGEAFHGRCCSLI